MLREDLAAGRLVELLTEFRSPPRAVHAIYPHRRLMPAKLRSFLEFLAERFREEHSLATEEQARSGA
jgi:DNA-binding transcriptional LysR family regulator